MSTGLAIVISGLVLGSLYSLMAGGLSIVWATLRVFNFAYGAAVGLGGYLILALQEHTGSLAAAAIGGILGLMAVSAVLEWTVVRPFVGRRGGDLVVMVSTLAAATIIQNAIQLIWGPQLQRLPEIASGSVTIGGAPVGVQQLILVALAPAMLLSLAAGLKWTRAGLAVRSVEQNTDVASLFGVPIRRAQTIVFALGGGLAAVAALFLGGIYFVTPTMGSDPLLKAFIVIVFGGLGSLGGTVAGAYAIGLVESVSTYYVGLYWTPVVLFGAMIAVMLIRPTGLFGEAHA
jgi:branched-chain amino acid transport system permease protein